MGSAGADGMNAQSCRNTPPLAFSFAFLGCQKDESHGFQSMPEKISLSPSLFSMIAIAIGVMLGMSFELREESGLWCYGATRWWRMLPVAVVAGSE